MANLWKTQKKMLQLMFWVKNIGRRSKRSREEDYKEFLKAEKRKAVFGAPIALIASWYLLANQDKPYSISSIMNTFLDMEPIVVFFFFPVIMIPWMLLLSAAGYLVFGSVVLIGWIQVRFFRFPK